MKFDTVIIGGGLSGLITGISLLEKGINCAIISTGQSALHFSSGSFDFLGYVGDEEVSDINSTISKLPANHPYSIIGADNYARLVKEVQPLFERIGVKLNGDPEKNHYRITPMGGLKPTLFSLDEFATVATKDSLPWKKVSLQNIEGFLDFNTNFIAEGLESQGVECSITSFSLPELERIRKSPTEMRSTNIAKILDNKLELERVAKVIENNSGDCEAIFLPAVFGLHEKDAAKRLKELISKPVYMIPAIPPSVPGIRLQILLKKYFESLGGTFLLGDVVTSGLIIRSKLQSINTSNLGDISIEADNFVIASGSLFSHGLKSNIDTIYEPIFGLDLNTKATHKEWSNPDIFADQPFMSYGLVVDSSFHTKLKVNPIYNLYAVGSIIGGCNPLKESCGAGVSILTALRVAELIAAN